MRKTYTEQHNQHETLKEHFVQRLRTEWEAGRQGTVVALTDSLVSGDRRAIEDHVGVLVDAWVSKVAGVSSAAFYAAGRNAATQVSISVDNPHSFDPERSIRHLRDLGALMKKNLGKETRKGILQALTRGVRAEYHPTVLARKIQDTAGLTRRQEQALVNYREGLRRGDRAVLTRRLRDTRFDGAVARAVLGEVPLTAEQIDRIAGHYRRRLLQYRTESIARTETLRSLHAGNYECLRQVSERGVGVGKVLRRYWLYIRDSRTRAWHVRIPALNAEGVSATGRYRTPLGRLRYPHDPAGHAEDTIACRCTEVFRIVSAGGTH